MERERISSEAQGVLRPERPEIRSALPYSPKFGCAIAIIALVIATLLGTYLVHTGLEQNRQIDGFTAGNPLALPVDYSSPEEMVILRAKLEHFASEAEAGREVAISLSTQDINDLIGHEDRLFELRGKVVFTGISDALEARISLPMRTVFQGGRHRWLNGDIRLQPALRDDLVTLDVVSLNPDHGAAPDGFVSLLRSILSEYGNYLRPYADDKRLGPVFASINRVELEAGQVWVHSRGVRGGRR
ncbi:MAG TPA: hypothetical protein VMN36_04230 [Verrucomicrobiales bacterium]|nr:hypothetical protein [Verrucomicrobiales bacterium]